MEIPRIERPMETERERADWWLPGALGRGMGSNNLIDTGFPFRVMEVWELDRSDGCTTL